LATRSDGEEWVRRYQESHESVPRLVCFPHAGGAANYYFPLSRALAPEIEVLAIQYPGRQDRLVEKPAVSITELADGAYAALRDRRTLGGSGSGQPVALFGHSMGAVIAFEVARRMQQDGLTPPTRLFVSGRCGPTIRRDRPFVHTLDQPGLIAELRRIGGTDEKILDNPDLQELFLPTIRSDYQAIETYQYVPGPPLNCPITALTGDNDPVVTPEEAAAWEQHGTGRFDLRVYTGAHFYLEAHSADVTELLRTEIAKERA
jgi:pyochelin biosynthesis protein PchC